MMKRLCLLLVICLAFSGCSSDGLKVDNEKHLAAASEVTLGMSLEKLSEVMSKNGYVQTALSEKYIRYQSKFPQHESKTFYITLKDNKVVSFN